MIVTRDEVHVVDAHPVAAASSTPPAPATSTPPGSCTGSRTATTSAPPGRLGALAAAEVIAHLGAAPAGVARGAGGARCSSRRLAVKLPRYRTGDPELDAEVAELVDAGRRSRRTPTSSSSSSRRRCGSRATAPTAATSRSRTPRSRRCATRSTCSRRTARRARSRSSARPARSPTTRSTSRPATSPPRWPTRDWMVITGAGPGIMEAGIEGAGPEHAFGVSIRLPFEAATTPVHRRRPEARELPLLLHPQARVREGVGRVRAAARRLRHARRGVRAADAAADRQGAARAGRAARRPRRHLLARRGSEFVDARARGHAATSRADDLAPRAASPTTSTSRSTRSSASTRNYHSLRFVDGRLVLRMQRAPDRRRARGAERASSPTSSCAARSSRSRRRAAEIADDDHVDLARLAFRFDRRSWARLRELIDRLNGRPGS